MYTSQAFGTSPDADRYQIALLRRRTPRERYAIAASLILAGKRIALQRHRRRRGDQGDAYFGKSLLAGTPMTLNGPAENWVQDPIEIAKILHRAMTEAASRQPPVD
jgi:hypothetical protein